MAHWFWRQDRRVLAYYVQSRSSEVFGVDIHPAAPFGRGIFFDHATGIVVGETAAIDDDVSILQGVTLGGTGKECGDRHPKVRSGVMISAGARVLGNIVVGEGAKVGANSVVLSNVPPHTTVVGVPARVVGAPGSAKPSLVMDQSLDIDGFDPGI
jgi:serine O-acetyltransferase